MIHNLVVGNINSADYDVYVLDSNDEETTSREYDTVSVYGKSGDLHFDKGRYENIDREYRCVIMNDDMRNAENYLAALMTLVGYQRIEDSLHPEYYKLGIFNGNVSPSFGMFKKASKFVLKFNCKPQKWLKSGEEEITLSASNKVYNPTLYGAYPVFEITGNGSIGAGGKTITIANNPDTMILDTELGDAYSKSAHANYNQYVTVTGNDFPSLKSGLNNITKTSITTLKMKPRWWTL